jgi:DNA polymerase kappa
MQTCREISEHRAMVYLMDKYFGRDFLFRTYLGIGSNVVQPHQRGERKSIGAERSVAL